nr:hypothetical protein GCM10020063_047910 [Dactylosporangium thailandense]
MSVTESVAWPQSSTQPTDWLLRHTRYAAAPATRLNVIVTLEPLSEPVTVDGAGSRPLRLIIGAWLVALWLGPMTRAGGVTVDQNGQAARLAPGPVPPVGLVVGLLVGLGLLVGDGLFDGDGLAGAVVGGGVVPPPPEPVVSAKSSA